MTPAHPRRTRGRTRSAAVPIGFVLLAALLLTACGRSSYQYDWNIVVDSVIRPDHLILSGIWLTLSISVISQLIGVVLGVFGAIGRIARLAPVRWLASFYVWFFRGTPLLVQITFIFYGLGVTGVYRWPELTILSITIGGAIQAGIVALALNEGAYMTEIVRAGILAIDPGQMEAAKSLGMTYRKAMRRIVLPQAVRHAIPNVTNDFIALLKDSSLVSVITVVELTKQMTITAIDVRTWIGPGLTCAALYFAMSYPLGILSRRLERKLEGEPIAT